MWRSEPRESLLQIRLVRLQRDWLRQIKEPPLSKRAGTLESVLHQQQRLPSVHSLDPSDARPEEQRRPPVCLWRLKLRQQQQLLLNQKTYVADRLSNAVLLLHGVLQRRPWVYRSRRAGRSGRRSSTLTDGREGRL